jgi:hypothetical protein
MRYLRMNFYLWKERGEFLIQIGVDLNSRLNKMDRDGYHNLKGRDNHEKIHESTEERGMIFRDQNCVQRIEMFMIYLYHLIQVLGEWRSPPILKSIQKTESAMTIIRVSMTT